MDSRTVLAMAALVGVPACGAEEESSEAGADRDSMEDADVTPQSFVVGLDQATTAESLIPQILEAGQPQLTDRIRPTQRTIRGEEAGPELAPGDAAPQDAAPSEDATDGG